MSIPSLFANLPGNIVECLVTKLHEHTSNIINNDLLDVQIGTDHELVWLQPYPALE